MTAKRLALLILVAAGAALAAATLDFLRLTSQVEQPDDIDWANAWRYQ